MIANKGDSTATKPCRTAPRIKVLQEWSTLGGFGVNSSFAPSVLPSQMLTQAKGKDSPNAACINGPKMEYLATRPLPVLLDVPMSACFVWLQLPPQVVCFNSRKHSTSNCGYPAILRILGPTKQPHKSQTSSTVLHGQKPFHHQLQEPHLTEFCFREKVWQQSSLSRWTAICTA